MSHNKPISNYAEKLRDPRWQKKRLEVMQRDGFVCQICNSRDKTLHVHHCFYTKNRDPWDYPENSLVTLCLDCHEEESLNQRECKEFLINELCSHGLLSDHLQEISASIMQIGDIFQLKGSDMCDFLIKHISSWKQSFYIREAS